MENRCQQCGFYFGSDVPDYIIEKCWECRFIEEGDDRDRYMGSDSDFSDHALGIDY